MQVSLLSGVLASEQAEFVASHPLNLEPLILDSGIAKGQLRSAAGAVTIGTGPGVDRGGIIWNDVCYRVSGQSLVRVAANGAVTVLGEVGGSGPAGLDYSFDRLIIRSDDRLYYWNGEALVQVTDVDLGAVVDVIWIDGYTMATDGQYVVVTELSDPMQIKPLKYGSAESDPDPITGLIKLAGEVYVLGRNTIQVFRNVGGNGFPFDNVPGATISFGCVSASTKCLFGSTFAFVGSARGDALGVFVAGGGSASKISTRVIDDALSAEHDPGAIVLERRVARDELRLLVHLSRETWIFCAKATEAAGQSIWYRAASGRGKPYRPRGAVMAYGRTIVGDTESGAIGALSPDTPAHFGDDAEWRFDCGLLYGGAKGAIIDRIELVGLPGRGEPGTAFMSISRDGETWSPERAVSLYGERTRRIEWRPHARMRNYMALRFRGHDAALIGFATCEVTARPLRV